MQAHDIRREAATRSRSSAGRVVAALFSASLISFPYQSEQFCNEGFFGEGRLRLILIQPARMASIRGLNRYCSAVRSPVRISNLGRHSRRQFHLSQFANLVIRDLDADAKIVLPGFPDSQRIAR